MSTYEQYNPQTATANPQSSASGYTPYGQDLSAYQPAYSPTGRPPDHPQATTVLVLGILGLCVAGILGPFAWYLGNKATKECQAGLYTINDQLRIGRILGIVATVVLIVAGIVGISIVILSLLIFMFAPGI
jgi:hypothetical protein